MITTGCDSTDNIKEVPVLVHKAPLNLDLPEPVDYKDVSFVVITDKNSDSIFLDLTSQNKLPVLVCTTPDTYKNLSENTQNTENYMLQLQSIIEKYKEYYESKKVLDKTN